MKEHFWEYIFSAAGVTFACAVLLFASKWVIAQEVGEQMEPVHAEQAEVKKEYQQFSQTVAEMQFEERNAKVQEERDRCLKENSVIHCNALAEWRWDDWYPYIGCIAPIEKYIDREPTCGPEPKFVSPVDE